MRVRSLLIGSVAAAALAVPAFGADLSVKAPPISAPITNWSGLYVGANGGCGRNTPSNLFSPIIDTDPGGPAFVFSEERQGGCFGGLQAGYNLQFAPNWVAGIEADGQFGEFRSRGQTLEPEGNTPEILANNSQNLRNFGTVRARLGYASNLPVFGNSLLYVTGGYAWAHNSFTANAFEGPNGTQIFQDNKTLSGYTVGGGLEVALDRHFSLKAEYLYLDFGNHTYNAFVSDDGTPFTPFSSTSKMHTVRVGLNYRIN